MQIGPRMMGTTPTANCVLGGDGGGTNSQLLISSNALTRARVNGVDLNQPKLSARGYVALVKRIVRALKPRTRT